MNNRVLQTGAIVTYEVPPHRVIERFVWFFYYCHKCRVEWYSRLFRPDKPCRKCKSTGISVRDK